MAILLVQQLVILRDIQRDLSKAQVTDIEKDFPTEMLWVSSKIWIGMYVSDEVLPNHITNKLNCVLPCPLLVLSSEN